MKHHENETSSPFLTSKYSILCANNNWKPTDCLSHKNEASDYWGQSLLTAEQPPAQEQLMQCCEWRLQIYLQNNTENCKTSFRIIFYF